MKDLQSLLRNKKKQHPLNKMFFNKLQDHIKSAPGFKEILSFDKFKELAQLEQQLNDRLKTQGS